MASSDDAGAVAGMDCVVLHQICEGDRAVALGGRGSGVCLSQISQSLLQNQINKVCGLTKYLPTEKVTQCSSPRSSPPCTS